MEITIQLYTWEGEKLFSRRGLKQPRLCGFNTTAGDSTFAAHILHGKIRGCQVIQRINYFLPFIIVFYARKLAYIF